MAKNYTIDNTKKVILADIPNLTEQEEAEVSRFMKYGFSVQYHAEKKEEVKRLDEAAILDYLKDDEAAKKEYFEKKDAPALDEKGEPKKTSTGKIRTQGFNAGRNWFTRTYPKKAQDALDAIKKAGLSDKFESAYAVYERKEAEEGTAKMNRDEYARDFYWKKVFKR